MPVPFGKAVQTMLPWLSQGRAHKGDGCLSFSIGIQDPSSVASPEQLARARYSALALKKYDFLIVSQMQTVAAC